MTTSANEKRQYNRLAIWFPVTILSGGREIWAICRDASPGGVLVSAVSSIAIGEKVEARFKVRRAAETEWTAPATVVRHEATEDEMVLAFPFRLALEFVSPIEELLTEAAAELEASEN